MDANDCSLHSIRPPDIDHLPIEEQLQHFHQRDIMPSHIFRVGMKIFSKKPPVRRRIIDSSICWKPSNVTKTNQRAEPSRKTVHVHVPTITPSPPAYSDYKAWISQRRQMRETLDSIGAHEQWLMSKECTPIEATLLAKLKEEKEREERDKLRPPPLPLETSGSDDEELTPAELKRMKLKERNQLLKDVRRLQKFLKVSRTRIAEFVVPYDTMKNYLVPTELLVDYLERLQPSTISLNATVALCNTLERETSKEGKCIDYRKLFNEELENLVLKYLELENSDIGPKQEESITSLSSDESHSTSELLSSCSTNDVVSTMDGERGVWAREVKENSQKQFLALLGFCQKHGVVLDRKLAKRALLMPPDKTRQQCLQHIRQPGTNLISRKLVMPPRENDREEQGKEFDYVYGWQYLQIRGPLHSKLMRLPTGTIRVKAKTNTWLTFTEFEELTKEIQSRPGFNYKYHGLPPDSAFWPGALQDKLRLYRPEDTMEAKPCSLYNIFQPIEYPKINKSNNNLLPTGRGVIWPENESGHVQLGSSLARTRKTYIV